MKGKLAFLISSLIIISALGQPIAGSAPAGDAVPQAPPSPVSGVVVIDWDWVVMDYSRYHDAVIYLTGNLSVILGGHLEFINTTLVMNLTRNGQFNIVVNGRFSMNDRDANPGTQQDASVIMSNNTLHRYTITFHSGSQLDFRNSIIRHCGYDGLNQGMAVSTGTANIDGMLFENNHYGLVIKASGALVQNSVFNNHYYAVYGYFCNPTLRNLTITGSTARGIYLYYSKPVLSECNLINNRIGIYFQNSEPDVMSCNITGSQTAGVYTWNSSPLLVDCELSNTLDMDVMQNSFPRLLNTTLDPSRVRVSRGLYVSVGNYLDVLVVNGTGSPVPSVSVAVLDSEGNPASSGVTDHTGTARNLAFRESFLTGKGPVLMVQHRVMAFFLNGENVTWGQNVTALTNGTMCTVTVSDNPVGAEVWPHGTVISGSRLVSDTTIISLGNIAVSSGTLEMVNSELLFFSQSTRSFLLESGSLVLTGSTVSSAGTSRKLEPARFLLSADAASPVTVTDSRVRWATESIIRSGLSEVRNLSVSHASIAGLKVISCSPRIIGLDVNWSPVGLHLNGDNAKMSEISVSGAREYGVYASQSAATLARLSVYDSNRGFYSYNGMLGLSESDISGCGIGIYPTYTVMQIDRVNIADSPEYGLYAVDSSVTFLNGNISNSGTAIHIQNSDFLGNTLSLMDNELGMRVSTGSPVLLNSSFGNSMEISLERGSSVALVNCSIDTGKTDIPPSAFIDMGNWANVLVLDEALQPVPGCNVSVTDSLERVSGSGMTGQDGILRDVAFRQERLFWNGTEQHHSHSILAFRDFNGSLQGSLATPLSPGDTAAVHTSPSGMGWVEWVGQTFIYSDLAYGDSTVIAHGRITIDTEARLDLENSTLRFYGDPASTTVLEVKSGEFNLLGSRVMPLSTRAPLQASAVSIIYRALSSGAVTDSVVSGIDQLVTYTDNLLVSGSMFSEMRRSGISVQSCSPTIHDTTFQRCGDGLWSGAGSPVISNSSAMECTDSGFYSSGGAPRFSGVTSINNVHGFYLADGSGALISDCSADGNAHGFYVDSSTPEITRSHARNNTDSGFHLRQSHPVLESLVSQGNMHGLNCFMSWPSVFNSTFNGNENGVQSYQSSPYLESCVLDGNAVAINTLYDALDITASAFSSGKSQEHSTFVNGGRRDHISITLPSRAVVRSANMTVRGSELGGDAVIEDRFTQFSPEIHGDWVVWQDYRDGVWNIHAYDLSMDSDGNGVPNYLETPPLEDDPALFRVTDSPAHQVDPDIFEDTVIWVDYRNGDADIYAYTFSNNTEWAVCTDPGAQLKPAIDGDRIVWQDLRSGNYDIYMYNISTGDTAQLSSGPDHDMGVNIHGNYVVWYSYRGSPGNDYSDIYLFNIKAWSAFNINDDNAIQYSPDVHGDKVVWHDNRNGNWEIYSYNITTSAIERLTYDVDSQQNFMARIYGNRVVYYFHNQLTNLWSARMFDIDTGTQTILERDLKGDSHPVIHGNRIAWVNRTDNKNDVYVLDLSLTGFPEDVEVDINADGSAELFHPGALDGRAFMNGTWLADVFNVHLDSVSGRPASIPVSVAANGTGRVILGPISIRYDIPTYIVNCTISNSGVAGSRSSVSSPAFINSSFLDNALDFSMNSGANPIALNTSFSEAKLQFQDKLSNLTVRNYLHVRVENLTGAPLDAGIVVADNGQTVLETTTGADGQSMWMPVTDRTHNITGRHDNATTLTAIRGMNLFADNPRNVNMSSSRWEVFITGSVGPEISEPFPQPGWTTSQARPLISAIITDDIGMDLSTVRLYVQTFAVFYSSTAVPGGFNISYLHPLDFPDGTSVSCRLYGRDTHGNEAEFSWEFLIDHRAEEYSIELQPGWNLISIPFETFGTSVESVLWTVSGRYDSVKAYSNGNGWLGYRPGRAPELNSLAAMNRTTGYWVHATEYCILTISGIPVESTAITLRAGWNLVGYPSMSEQLVVVALWGTSADRVEIFDSESPYLISVAPSSQTVRPGEAFWVRVPADTVWVVEW